MNLESLVIRITIKLLMLLRLWLMKWVIPSEWSMMELIVTVRKERIVLCPRQRRKFACFCFFFLLELFSLTKKTELASDVNLTLFPSINSIHLSKMLHLHSVFRCSSFLSGLVYEL